MAGTEIGEYFVVPVIPSFDGIDRQINQNLGKALGGKKIGAQLGKDITDGVKSGEAEMKRAVDGYSKLYDKWADAAGKVKVAQKGIEELEAKGITSGQRYERVVQAKEKALRDQNRALRDAKDAYGDYEKALKRASSAEDGVGGGLLDKLKGAAGKARDSGTEAASGFVEGFGGPIAAIGARGGPIGLALAAAAGVALAGGVLIGKNVMAGMDREVAADRLQAQLGLSDRDAAAFGQSAGTVYAGAFGESMGDVQSAMADVASTLGTSSGAALEDMTAKALTFRDVFGTETSESIAFAQNLIVNGLAADASQAFDMMATAYQRVPSAMRYELPEILQEYSTYFQSLGFSGEEAFGMLIKTAPQGKIALDKLGDSLKEFTLLATDVENTAVQDMFAAMGLSGQDVANNLLAGGEQAQAQFDQVIDKLRGIQDPASQAAAAITLFGTPLEDLDKSKIPQFLASLDNAEQAMQGFAGSSQQMVDTVGDNAATSVESAKRAIETGAASMQTSLAQAFGPGIEQVANFLVEHQDDITGFFMTSANAGAEFGAVMLGTASTVVRGFGMTVQAIGDAAGFVVDAFEGMVGGAAAVADAVGLDGLAGDMRNAQAELGTWSDKLHGAGDNIVEFSGLMHGGSMSLHDFDANLGATQTSAANATAQINNVASAVAGLPSGHQINIDAIVVYKDQQGRAIDPSQLLGFNPEHFATAGDAQRARRGLPYNRPGPVTPSVTSVAPSAGVTPTPFVLPSTASGSSSSSSTGSGGSGGDAPTYFDPSQWQLGSYPGDEALLAAVPAGRYTQTQGADLTQGLADCSSAVEDLVALMDGRPTGGRSLSTHNADAWLAEHGFVQGTGGPGDFRVAFNSGHMQATLPDGTPFNWGSDSAAARRGIGGSGADDPALTSRYYRPVNRTVSPGTGGLDFISPAVTPTPDGGWEVDPQAVMDARNAVLRDQEELEEKNLKLLELKAQGNAKQSEVLAAEHDIEQQKRDLAASQAKLAEAQRGKLREATSSTSSARGQGGMGQFGELGNIAGSFLKETFGFDGSVFPDISNTSAMNAVNTLLGFFAPQMQALADGAAPGTQTSSSAFGMPDVAVPPMPAPGVHGGSGQAPGPSGTGGNPVVIDQSIHGNVGWDPRQVRKERDEGLARAIPRIPPR